MLSGVLDESNHSLNRKPLIPDNSESRWNASGPIRPELPPTFQGLTSPSRARRISAHFPNEGLDAPPPSMTDDDESIGCQAAEGDASDDSCLVDDGLQ
jgi:hypothetical protein